MTSSERWRQVTNCSTTSTASEMLNKEETNEHLTFYNILIAEPTDTDITVFRTAASTIVPAPVTSESRNSSGAFRDGGAATNICSPEFVTQHNLRVEPAGEREISAYRGPSFVETIQRAVFTITIKGKYSDNDEAGQIRIVTSALIIPGTHTPLILGADFLALHDVVCMHGRRLDSFAVNGRRFQVEWIPWSPKEQSHLTASMAAVESFSDLVLSNTYLRKTLTESGPALSTEQLSKMDPIAVHHYIQSQPYQFMQQIQQFNCLNAFTLTGLCLLNRLYGIGPLEYHTQKMLNALGKLTLAPARMFAPLDLRHMKKDKQLEVLSARFISQAVLSKYLEQAKSIVKQDDNGAKVKAKVARQTPSQASKLRIAAASFKAFKELPPPKTEAEILERAMERRRLEVYHQLLQAAAARPCALTPPKPAPVEPAAGDDKPEPTPEPEPIPWPQRPEGSEVERHQLYWEILKSLDDKAAPAPTSEKGLAEHEDFITCLKEECTQEWLDMKPELYPTHLWLLTADSLKPEMKQRWSVFTPERIKESLAAIDSKIRIYDESPERLAQKTFIRAQIVANLDAYFHPDPDRPPTIPGVEMEINLIDPKSRPVNTGLRRQQPLERASLRARIRKLLRQGKIRDSKSSYNNPVHMVPNKERIAVYMDKYGADALTAAQMEQNEAEVIDLYRMTGDFRLLNLLTELERFPLPRIMELIDSCTENSNRYSSGDLQDAFFVLCLKESCRHLTAFSTPDGHYEYCVMPQGVKSAANIWARTIQNIFADMLYVYKILVYQDDIVNTAKNFGEHYRTQQAIYQHLQDNLMVFKPTKTTLNFPAQRILGHVMSELGRQVDGTLVETIQKLGPPRNLHDVQSLLGLAKVAIEYVPGLAAILDPIAKLNRKHLDTQALWAADPQCEEALSVLKLALTSAPVLMIPRLERRFRVECDACRIGHGLGAVLLQETPETWHLPEAERKWKPVAYWSRTLASDSERKFSATELEATVLHDSIMHWYCFLFNTAQSFDVIVDHYALVYLVTKMGKSVQSHQRLTRLCLDLQGYNFNVIHRNGKDHLAADAVSRLLHRDEIAFVHNETTLRDDCGPLTEQELTALQAKYKGETEWLLRTVEAERVRRSEEKEELAKVKALQVANIHLHLVQKDQHLLDAEKDMSRLSDAEAFPLCQSALPLPQPATKPGKCDVKCLLCQQVKVKPPLTINRVSLLDHFPAAWTEHIKAAINAAQSDEATTLDDVSHRKLKNLNWLLTDHNQRLHEPKNTKTLHQYVRALQRHIQMDISRILPSVRLGALDQLIKHGEAAGADMTAEELRLYRRERARRHEHMYDEHHKRLPQFPKSQKKHKRRMKQRLRQAASAGTKTVHLSAQQTQKLQREADQILLDYCGYIAQPKESELVIAARAVKAVNNKAKKGNYQSVANPTVDNVEDVQLTAESTPQHDTRRSRAAVNEAETRRLELLDNRLEEYYFLVGQIYCDPQTLQLYEIIDLTIQRRALKNGGATVFARAWPINPSDKQSHEDGYITPEFQRDPSNHQKLDFLTVRDLINEQLDRTNPQRHAAYPMIDTEWTELQLQDPWCAKLMEKLDGTNGYNLHPNGRKDDRHCDLLHRPIQADGSLGPLTRTSTVHRDVKNGLVTMTEFAILNQLVVPEAQQSAVVQEHHNQLGHPGAARTHKTVRLRYWWPTVVADCTKHAKQCRYCELRKANNNQPKVPVQEYPVPPFPHHTVAIDLTGPFSKCKDSSNSSKKNQEHHYILVYKCALTKWVECVAVPNKRAATVVEALIEIFHRRGSPSRLLSDRGGEFSNDLMKSVCKLLLVRHIRITPVNPRANGLAENQMRTLKDMLSHLVNAKQDNWSQHLGAVAHIYNTTVNAATGYTPFYLNNGRQCATPDLDYLTKRYIDLDTSAEELAQVLRLAWRTIGGSTWASKTELYNARPAAPLEFMHYRIDQLVYIKKVPRRFYRDLMDEQDYILSAKLQARYAGPFRVTAVKSDVLYTAEIHGQERTIHAVNMKPAMVELHVVNFQPARAAQDEQDHQVAQQEEDAQLQLMQDPLDLVPMLELEQAKKNKTKKPIKTYKAKEPTPVPYPPALQDVTITSDQPILPHAFTQDEAQGSQLTR